MELITLRQADLIFMILPILGVVIGTVAAVMARRASGNPLASALLYGGPFVLMGILWRIYEAISDRLGAGTVVNLLVNLALFLVVGKVCGLVWTRVVGPDTKDANGRSGN